MAPFGVATRSSAVAFAALAARLQVTLLISYPASVHERERWRDDEAAILAKEIEPTL